MAATNNFKQKFFYFLFYIGALAFLVGAIFQFFYGPYAPTVPDEATGRIYVADYKGVNIYLTFIEYIFYQVLLHAGFFILFLAMPVQYFTNKKK